MDTVELFTGCGGLALGLARAGFQARRMSEWDKHSVANIEFNRANGLKPISHWPIHMEDVRTVKWSDYHRVDLVAGGPPASLSQSVDCIAARKISAICGPKPSGQFVKFSLGHFYSRMSVDY